MSKIAGVFGAFVLGIPLLLAPLTTGGVKEATVYAAEPRQDPTPPAPVPPPQPPVRIPVEPTPPPPPTPLPSATTPLNGEEIYVIDADVPCIVLTSPSTTLKMTTDTGPMKIRGKFVEGGGKCETRTFNGKYLYLLEAASATSSGTVDLIIIPSGAKGNGDVIRRTLVVNGGSTPPNPPNPPAPTDPLTIALQAAYTADTGADKAASLSFLQLIYAGLATKAPTLGIKINQDLFNALKAAIDTPSVGLTATQLVGVRKLLATELTNTFSSSPSAPVDATKLVTELTKISQALAKVK